jgi:hypothetical protein
MADGGWRCKNYVILVGRVPLSQTITSLLSTQRNATQRNATQRNATQRNATQYVAMSLAAEDVSQEYLAQELEATETALNETLRLQIQTESNDYDYDASGDGTGGGKHSSQTLPKSFQLSQLAQTVDTIAMAQAMTEWVAQAPVVLSEDQESSSSSLIATAEWCDRLSRVIAEYSTRVGNGIMVAVYEEKYLPLYEYLYPSLLKLLRSELEASQYPKKKGSCATLIRQCQTSPDISAFAQACYWIMKLQTSHQLMLEAIDTDNTSDLQEISPSVMIVRELMRPFVRRICFHFVETSPDRATTTRIDRLPEWLLNYVRENVLEGTSNRGSHDSPHDLIHLGLTCVLSSEDAVRVGMCFWQEMVQLIQFVLTERRFFRHPDIVGPRSNPIHLYNAMENFLLFDKTLREAAPVTSTTDQDQVLFGLMDTLVMADDELRQWWIAREREAVFTTLFEDDSMTNVPKPLANHVSPRAEIFCALIRSVQWKASILTAPGIYLRNVAVPLCSQFVDALHETSTDLRNLLCQPTTRGAVAPSHLVSNLHEWIEIINGTRLAANVLLREGAWQDGMPATSQSDHDLARFGRSLERLVEVLVEELASSFVETILMERAKFASYLMMASHLLASREWEGDDRDLSAELKETRAVLGLLQSVCSSILSVSSDQDQKDEDIVESRSWNDQQIAHFAPRAVQTHVFNRVADKFLEVALDIHNMAPDLWQEGAGVFARDVDDIVASFSHLPLVRRLLDVTELLTMNSGSSQGLLAALGGLVGATDFLDIHDFSSDETVYDEAVMMLKAKGFAHLELKDAVSILNRRRD